MNEMTQRGIQTFAQLLDCAHALADASGAAIRPHFRTRLAVADKGGAAGFDPVTAADQAAERAIIAHLAAHYPDHGIVGEEYGTHQGDARYRWVVDPIDGTRAFITGMPTWGTLIGLMEGSTAVLGLMDQPFTGERYWASSQAAHLRTVDGTVTALATRACPTLATATFCSTHPDLFAPGRQRAIHDQLKAAARLTRYGGDCYGYCQLAAGHIDVIVEPGLQVYDIAALVPIIERAGGRVTTWEGASAVNGGDIVATGDPALHEVVLGLINRCT